MNIVQYILVHTLTSLSEYLRIKERVFQKEIYIE